MAIDTENKRRSTLCVLPSPNGIVNEPDRRQAVWQYAGLLTNEPRPARFARLDGQDCRLNRLEEDMPATYRIVKGNTRVPMGWVIIQGGKPLDMSDLAVTFYMNDASGAAVLAETSTGITRHPTFTFTADASTDRIVRNDHLIEDWQQVVFSSTGTLPAGLTAGTRYFPVQVSDNAFKVSDVRNGAVIDITGAGTGVHTMYVLGSVQFDFASDEVDTAGIYHGWFVVDDGEESTFPNTEDGIRIEIVAAE